MGVLACSLVERRQRALAKWLVAALGLFASGCVSTVEPGEDFDIADVVYDENYYYCVVEPMLFTQRCGAGDPGLGESGNGCHFSVTSFRLQDYAPLVADSCGGSLVPGVPPPPAATENYGSASLHMALDPDLAALLNRPTGKASHPRVIFDRQSPEADVIRQWATQFSTQ